MGEVYRAKDSKLKRDVAIKVLPAGVASDRERLARFQREAEVLASLNHPNIAQVYGLEETSPRGTPKGAPYAALIMELVDGDDLSQRIARGPMPIDEALPIAKQIADALEAAHEQGIIHRDLKPANIKVRPDATVKVLDFGLAKALEPGAGNGYPGSGNTLANSPTTTSPAMTMRGVSLGTAAYMSPEQAKGKPVDKRADIWAFGCVLYEMLTGRRPFKGEDVTDIITSVMRDTPEWNALPANTPPAIWILLRRCLEKDPRKRAPHMAIARMELEDAMTSTTELVSGAGPVVRRAGIREVGAWSLAGALIVALAAVIVIRRPWSGNAVTAVPPIRFTVGAPAGQVFQPQAGSLSISPDGRKLAYILQDNTGRGTIWIRGLDEPEAKQVAISVSAVIWTAAAPTWSRDGQYLLLTAGTSIGGPVRKIDLTGRPLETLADWGRNAIWSADGTVIYSGRDARIYRVPANGGTSAPITTIDVDAGEVAHTATQFLPDGRRYLLLVVNRDPSKNAVYVATTESAERTVLRGVHNRAVYAGGLLWFLRDCTLVAQRFDASTGAATGEIHPVTEHVDDFAVAAETMVTRSRIREGRAMAWLDSAGRASGETLEALHEGVRRPDLSPDGKRLAFARGDAASRLDVWPLDRGRRVPTTLPTDPASDDSPWFSPDGTRIAFSSTRNGVPGIYWRRADGSGADELLYESPYPKYVSSFSPDGTLLIFEQTTPESGADVWALPLTGARIAVPIAATESLEGSGTISPDGRWIAYCAGDPGEGDQIFIAPYPPDGSRIRLSTSFGSSPQWGPTGREVYYGVPDGNIMRVELTADGGTIRASVPKPWLKAPALFSHLSF